MAEYWNFEPNYEQKAKRFFANIPKPEMILNYDIAVKDFVHSGNASAQIKLFLKRLGVDAKVLRRVAVTSYEAEINITAHSFGGTIVGNIFPEMIHVIFQDRGPGLKNIEEAMTPGFSTASDLVREMGFGAGLGLPNIKKNSDVMHIVSAENESTMLEILIYY